MMIFADADFETRSRCDLRIAGAEAYSEHPTTEVICLVVHTSSGGRLVWYPGIDTFELEELAANPDVVWVAHNAAFEQAVWRNQMVTKFGLSPIPIQRWRCTMAAAAWKSLPLALDKLLTAIRATKQKDMEGRALTLSLSKSITKKAWLERCPEGVTKKDWAEQWPKDTLPEITPDIRERVIEYCTRDVEGEAEEVKRVVGLLHSHERGVWEMDQTINQRGVRIDLAFVAAAERVVWRASDALRREFEAITGGIGPGQIERIKEWCAMQGVLLHKLDKETIAALLGADDESTDLTAGLYTNATPEEEDGQLQVEVSLPLPVRRVLQIRRLLGSASIKKLARMRACVCSDGRARGLIQYHAAHTGRWGGRLLQPQNFPRGFAIKKSDGSPAEIEEIIAAIMTGDPEECSRFCRRLDSGALDPVHPIELVAASLRHALVPDPGKVFLVGDYSGIEARIVLAMAGQHDKCDLMASGVDVYLDMAEDIFAKPKGSWCVSDKALLKKIKEEQIVERTIGKNAILGCGFQMGANTFSRRYCSHQPPEFAERAVETYRKVWAPKVPSLWYALGDAALEACQDPDGEFEKFGVTYFFRNGYICARLPSGWQMLWYPNPAVEWDVRFERYGWSYSAWQGGHQRRCRAYGGLLTENAVQALARGLLVGSMRRVEAAGMPIVLTVHDEIVAEVDECSADQAAFEQIMVERSPWAAAMRIPVQVEGWSGDRYRK